MFDFRLKVFDTVARRQNFTKAAEELNITQPAVSKHIREIEQQLNVRLFERHGTRIRLTPAGDLLLRYTERLFEVYREMEFEMSRLNEQHRGSLRIGASTTIAQYVLPPILAAFHKKFEGIQVSMQIHNTEEIEKSLEQKQIDLGLIEGRSKNRSFSYTDFIEDEIVLTARHNHPVSRKGPLQVTDLANLNFVMREPGSGTLETIAYALKEQGVKLSDLNTETQLANTESIKMYLLNSDCVAFLSIHSILQELKNKTLIIIDLPALTIQRTFHFIRPQGGQSAVSDLFMKFAAKYDFRNK